MKVITLNNEAFIKSCSELVSKIKVKPDLLVGILNGGGYVFYEVKRELNSDTIDFKSVKLQRSNWIKNISLLKTTLRLLPYKITNKLRIIESGKARKSIDSFNLNGLTNQYLSFFSNEEVRPTPSNILILDDAIDTGKTMLAVKNKLTSLFPDSQIKVAVISWTIEKSIIKPDYFVFKNVLVRFPWSKDYKGKDFDKKSFSS